MLFLDNPAGVGFTYSEGGQLDQLTDLQVGKNLVGAMAQFMKLFPHMVPGAVASQTPFFAFGQSYGGAYVVSLAHVYLDHRENDPDFIRDINLRGIGKKSLMKSCVNAFQK